MEGKKKNTYVPKVYERATTYQLEMENEDGSICVWKYDKKKNAYGPYSTTTKYPPGYKFYRNVKIAKSQRTYLNPKTGREVSYARARNLGLV